MRFLALLLLCTSTLALHSSLLLCNIPFFSWTRTEVKPKQTSPPPQPILKAADHSIEAPVDPDPTEEPLDPTRSEEPVGWIPYNGNLYYLNNDRMDWLAALIWCFEQDSTLVSILSVEENFVVNDIVVSKLGSLCEEKKSKDQCRIIWSGAYHEKNLNEYAWSDQSEWTYANKVENETNLNFEKPVCLKVESTSPYETLYDDKTALSLANLLGNGRSVKPWIAAPCEEKHAFACKKKEAENVDIF